jgi:hypothetical protein
MKNFKNHQRQRRKYRFNIVGHKKALKIWWDSPFKYFDFIANLNAVLQFCCFTASRQFQSAGSVYEEDLHKSPIHDAGKMYWSAYSSSRSIYVSSPDIKDTGIAAHR